MFDSLVRWTEHNREERGVHFAKILSHVRLSLLSARTLNERVETEELVKVGGKDLFCVLLCSTFISPDKAEELPSQPPQR